MIFEDWMQYVRLKSARNGPCKICEKVTQLTWDHIPPKGGVTLGAVEIENVYHNLMGSSEERQYSISQDGVKYRSICSACNNALGSRYDRVLSEFAIGVGRYLNTRVHLPPVVKYKTRPMAIMKAILGHLLAAQLDLYQGKFDRDCRAVLFDDTKSIPDYIKIFFWVYPHRQVVVIRDVAMPSARNVRADQEFGIFFGILKYFPIGYVVCDLEAYEGLEELTKFRTAHISDEIAIPINLQSARNVNWPESVDDGNPLVLTHATQSSIIAKPRKK